MSLKTKVSSKLVSLTFGVLVICFAFGFYVYAAWVPPGSPPPGDNVDPPLNEGDTGQSKTGYLHINDKLFVGDAPTGLEQGADAGLLRTTKGAIINAGGAAYGLLVPSGSVGIGTMNPDTDALITGSFSETDINSTSYFIKGTLSHSGGIQDSDHEVYGYYLDGDISGTITDTLDDMYVQSVYGSFIDLDSTSALAAGGEPRQILYGSYANVAFNGTISDVDSRVYTYGTYGESGGDMGTTGNTRHFGGSFGAADTADVNYGILTYATGADKNYAAYFSAGDVALSQNNQKLYFGLNQVASIYYEPDNLIISPGEVGAGNVVIKGDDPIFGLEIRNTVANNDQVLDLMETDVNFDAASGAYGFRVMYDGGVNKFYIKNKIGGASAYTALTIDRTTIPHVHLPNDDQMLYFGAGDKAAISYDGTDMHIMPRLSGSGSLTVSGRIRSWTYMVSIASTVDPSPAVYTLNPPGNYVKIDCGDTDTCDITMGEAGAKRGVEITIVNISANVCDFSDTAGISELNGPFAMGQYDSLKLIYVDDRWVEVSRSNN